MNNLAKGYLFGILSAVTYGMNPFFGKRLYQAGLTPPSVLFYRFFFASLLIAAVILIRRESFRLAKRQILPILFSGVMVACSCFTWFLSFNLMDSGVAATILFVYPIMVAAMMTLLFHEKLTFATVGGILLSLLGVAVLCRAPGGANVNLAGVLCVLFSALSYAIYMVAVKKSSLKDLPPLTLTFYAMAISFILFFCLLRFGSRLERVPNLWAWGDIFGLALVPSLLAFLLMAVAIRYIGPTKTAILGALEPLTAAGIGIGVFGERFTISLLFGIVLILTSVLIVVCSKNKESQKAE